jgi:hypothetical protein
VTRPRTSTFERRIQTPGERLQPFQPPQMMVKSAGKQAYSRRTKCPRHCLTNNGITTCGVAGGRDTENGRQLCERMSKILATVGQMTTFTRMKRSRYGLTLLATVCGPGRPVLDLLDQIDLDQVPNGVDRAATVGAGQATPLSGCFALHTCCANFGPSSPRRSE